MTLYINTVLSDNIILSLRSKEQIVITKKIKVNRNQSEKLLPAIDQLLIKKNIKIKQIKKIIVADQGGSFTSLRIGVLTANALGYALKIPVEAESGQKNIKKFAEFQVVEPIYNAEPNIGVSKKKLI